MDTGIFLALLQDGLTTGAIYGLLAVGLILVFTVTRVIFVPQGDLVSYGALTLAMLQAGRMPGTLWLLDLLCAVALVLGWRAPRRALVVYLVAPALLTAACFASARFGAPAPVRMGLAILVVAPLGPLLYRFAFEPLGEAPVLVLLILAMALHFVLVGVALYVFGAEGYTTPALSDANFDVGPLSVSGQSLAIAAVCAGLVGGLRWFFAATLYGRALRAAASDRLGARLLGIDAALTGRLAFAFAAGLAALAGVLIAPVTPLAFDTGFELGLKGFVAAILGGLASYPAAVAGALAVGVLESFGSFWASEWRNIVVFAALIPVLLVLSLRSDDERA